MRPVIVLNGWGMTRAAWQPFLAALGSGARVQVLDLEDLLAGEAEDHGGLAARAGRQSPGVCDVIGWSLGAQVALRWAHDAPEQVRRLALIAATPCFVRRADWEAGMEAAQFEDFAAGVARDGVAALARFALLQAHGDANASAVARVLRAAAWRDAPEACAALQRGLALLRSGDLLALASRVRQRACLLHGAKDAVVPAAAAHRLLQQMPASRLLVFPDLGHAPHVSKPVALAAAIRGFFDEH
jgi:pimeloyl-[acyl-carrier protein] methyl ester esterase